LFCLKEFLESKKKSIPFSQFETAEGKNILIDILADKALLPDKASQLSELKNTFMAAIKKLSKKYSTVLSLYYYQYLNFREIAEVLQEPINTIKSRHRRGLILLKELVASEAL